MKQRLPDQARVALKSIQRALDNPPPRTRKRRASRPSPTDPQLLNVTRVDPAVWAKAIELADAAGVPRHRLLIDEDGTVTIPNH